MKRIALVDHKLENYHANVFLKAFRDPLKERGWTVAGCHALDAQDGRAWAEKNDVPYFDSPAALNQHADGYMILAPSNPELHLPLAEKIFPFGKPTYVDKTFAPDVATAKIIFDLADRHQVAVQTTSALRYTNVQAFVKESGGAGAVKHMIAWGGGSSFDEYAIHPLEMLVSCMGSSATSLMRRGTAEFSQLLINFDDGRTAVANIYTHGQTPFAASITTEKLTKVLNVDTAQMFINNAAAVLDLFESGKPSIDRAETMLILRTLEMAKQPAARDNFVRL